MGKKTHRKKYRSDVARPKALHHGKGPGHKQEDHEPSAAAAAASIKNGAEISRDETTETPQPMTRATFIERRIRDPSIPDADISAEELLHRDPNDRTVIPVNRNVVDMYRKAVSPRNDHADILRAIRGKMWMHARAPDYCNVRDAYRDVGWEPDRALTVGPNVGPDVRDLLRYKDLEMDLFQRVQPRFRDMIDDENEIDLERTCDILRELWPEDRRALPLSSIDSIVVELIRYRNWQSEWKTCD